MAEALPTAKDENPIIQAPAIESRSAGDDAIAQGYGKLGETAASITENVLKQKSNAQYMLTLSNLEKIKTDAEVNTIKNPHNAELYNRSAAQTMDVVTKAAQINSADRQKLDFYNSQNKNQLAIKAATVQHQQNQTDAFFSYLQSEPAQQKILEDSLLDTSPAGVERSKQLIEARHRQIAGLEYTGSMTPIQAYNATKLIDVGMTKAQNAIEFYKTAGADISKGADAANYQAHNANPMVPETPGALANTPASANTQTQMHYHNGDRSIGSVRQDIANGMIPDHATFLSLNPAQQAEATEYLIGAKRALGLTRSNASLTELKAQYQTVSGSSKWLSQRDEMFKHVLGRQIKMLETNNTRQFLDGTAIGQTINQNETSEMASINANGVLGDAEKYNYARNSYNKYFSQRVSAAQAQHLTNDQINVAPEVTSKLEDTFKTGNVNDALHTLNTLHNQNQLQAIEAMHSPWQKTVMQSVAIGLQNNPNMGQDYSTFVKANTNPPNQDAKGNMVQKADKFSDLYPSEQRPNKLAKDSAIQTGVIDLLTPQKILTQKQYDPATARQMNEGMQSAITNYIKQQAIDANDYKMVHINDYMRKAKQLVDNSYATQSGVNWTANGAQLKMNRTQLDWFADYGINRAQEAMAQKTGRPVSDFKNANITNKLSVTFTPTNELKVVDSYGGVVIQEPITSHMWVDAKRHAEERAGHKL